MKDFHVRNCQRKKMVQKPPAKFPIGRKNWYNLLSIGVNNFTPYFDG